MLRVKPPWSASVRLLEERDRGAVLAICDRLAGGAVATGHDLTRANAESNGQPSPQPVGTNAVAHGRVRDQVVGHTVSGEQAE